MCCRSTTYPSVHVPWSFTGSIFTGGIVSAFYRRHFEPPMVGSTTRLRTPVASGRVGHQRKAATRGRAPPESCHRVCARPGRLRPALPRRRAAQSIAPPRPFLPGRRSPTANRRSRISLARGSGNAGTLSASPNRTVGLWRTRHVTKGQGALVTLVVWARNGAAHGPAGPRRRS